MRYLVLLLTIITLASCGGGGGGGSPSAPNPSGTPQPDPQPNPDPPAPTIKEPTQSQVDAESNAASFKAGAGLTLINAAWAYARIKVNNLGEPGAGQKIGAIDGGLNHLLEGLKDKVDDASLLAYLLTGSAPISATNPVDLSGGDKNITVYCADNSSSGGGMTDTPSNIGSGDCYGKRAANIWVRIPRLSELNHGSNVAAIMAHKNGIAGLFQGVAWGIDSLLFHALDSASNEQGHGGTKHYGTTTFSTAAEWNADEKEFADAINFMTNANILAFNLSLGYQGSIENYLSDVNPIGRRPADVKAAWADIFTAIRQTNTDAADRTIMVVAAGNAFDDYKQNGTLALATSPEIIAGLALLDDTLLGHYLAVVGVYPARIEDIALNDITAGPDKTKIFPAPYAVPGLITSFSNRCGLAKAFCIAAPGYTVALDGTYSGGYLNGTSFAAPFVTAAFALLAQYFPDMGNSELVKRMLDTANKTGIYANSDIYGQGLLDLKAATEPVGDTQMPTGTNINNGGIHEAGSLFQTSDAMGDAIERAFRGKKTVVLDTLGAPFQRELSDYHSMQGQERLTTALHTLGTMRTLQTEDKEMRYRNMQGLGLFSQQISHYAMDGGKMIAPYLSLAGNGVAMKYRHKNLQVAAFHGGAERTIDNNTYYENSPSSGIMLGFQGSEYVGFQLGAIEEREGALGNIGRGAFYLGSRTMTWFSGLEMT
ncbi:MAG: S8 family serine peptidase, partial [Parvibaculales bacterium]